MEEMVFEKYKNFGGAVHKFSSLTPFYLHVMSSVILRIMAHDAPP